MNFMRKHKVLNVNIIMKNFNKILNFLATIITIVGIGMVGIIQPLKENIPFMKQHDIEKSIQSIRVTQSKEYIESLLGIANSKTCFQYNNFKINKEIYINDYCILICYYNDDSLNSYLLIANGKNFKYKDYRSNCSMLKDGLDKIYNKPLGYEEEILQNCGSRKDCNRYYVESYVHNLYGDWSTVGYGYCDIGYWNDVYNEKFEEMPSLFAKEMNLDRELNVNEKQELFRNTELRKLGYNMVFVSTFGEDFVYNRIINDCFSGLTKGQLKSLQ